MKIIQISDTHLFREKDGCLRGLNSLESLQACLAHINQYHSDLSLLLATGDLSQDGSEESYQHWLELVDSLKVPVLAIPGNHDNPDTMRTVFPVATLAKHCDLDCNWRLIQLDSSYEMQAAGCLSETELTRLEKLLNEKTDRFILISLHHPPVPTNSEWINKIMLQNADRFFQCLLNSINYQQIKAVVFGHIHQDFTSYYQHIALYAAPSTCIQFATSSREFSLDDKPPGYRCLELDACGTLLTKTVYL